MLQMDTISIILILAAFAVLAIFINRKLSEIQSSQKPSDDLLQVIRMLREGGEEDRRTLLNSIQRNSEATNERLDNAAKVIGDLQKNIGEFSEIGRGVRELQQFLQSPKLRGNIGEQVLKDLIVQMFPKRSFHLQYAFKSGDKVDAAIETSGGILPIDSKFPMENFVKMSGAEKKIDRIAYRKIFKSDIKKHVNAISRKYILPEEGTMDFALMYIPSESVYYEFVNSRELVAHAQNARVYPVSPSTLYSHLQTILLSFEGQKIEQKAKAVFTMLRALQKDYEKVDENLSTLQKHLNNAYHMMGNVTSGFSRLGQKISSTNQLEEGKNQ